MNATAASAVVQGPASSVNHELSSGGLKAPASPSSACDNLPSPPVAVSRREAEAEGAQEEAPLSASRLCGFA